MTKDYYEMLKVERLINASGTLTSLGGCKMRPSAAEAMALASSSFIDLEDFHLKAGAHIARLLNVEAACVTAGAAAGLLQATAACMTGCDPALIAMLPGHPPRYKVVIQCTHRNPFERAIRLAGAELIIVGDAIQTHPYDLEYALDESTAAVAHFLQADMLDASLGLDETLEIAHRHAIPVIVDAAAELPPKSNLWRLAQKGADLVIFSGSKDIGGPQPSGLMVGRSDLIKASMLQTTPHEFVPGRVMKAGKEVVAGFLCALEEYLQQDEERRFQDWERMCEHLQNALTAINGIQVKRFFPTQPKIQPPHPPRLEVVLDHSLPLTVAELRHSLRHGTPAIATETYRDSLWLNVHTMDWDDVDIITRRINEIIEERRSKPSAV